MNIPFILYFYTNKTFPQSLKTCFQTLRGNNFPFPICFQSLREYLELKITYQESLQIYPQTLPLYPQINITYLHSFLLYQESLATYWEWKMILPQNFLIGF